LEKPLELLEQDIENAIEVGSIPLITGESGVGKTAMIEAIFRRRKLPLYKLIGSLCDPTDINGFPVIGDEVITDSAGVRHKPIKFAPRDFMLEIVNKHGGRAGIFFDELTSVGPAVQAAMLTSMQTKRFGDFQLDPYKVAIVAACNPPGLAANGQELSLPMANRLVHMAYPCDHATAIEWAGNFVAYWGMPPKVGFDGAFVPEPFMVRARGAVAGFIVRMPSWWHYTLNDTGAKDKKAKEAAAGMDFAGGTVGFPTPRSWDRVAHHLGLCLSKNRSPLTIQRLVAGEVGVTAATDFQTYLQSVDIPDPEVVLAAPDKYEPSGRLDVDFTVMTGVTAAVEANPTADRVLACMTVCNVISQKRGAYEAGAVAVTRLGKLLVEKRLKEIADKVKMKPAELAAMKMKLYELYKPYMSMSSVYASPTE